MGIFVAFLLFLSFGFFANSSGHCGNPHSRALVKRLFAELSQRCEHSEELWPFVEMGKLIFQSFEGSSQRFQCADENLICLCFTSRK